jgi:hypothetical protein
MKNVFRNNLFFFGITFFFGSTVYAQYPLNNRLVQQNKFGINIAYAGYSGEKNLSVVNSYTPTRIDGGVNYFWNQSTLELPLNENLSTGTRFSYAQQDSFTQLVIEQALAYKTQITTEQFVSLGLSFGLNRQAINLEKDFSINKYVNKLDPILVKNNDKNQNDFRAEIATVYKMKNFEIALAVPFLIQDQTKWQGLTAYTSYKFETSPQFSITPSVLMVNTYAKEYEITMSINLSYLEKNWIQMSYTDSRQLLIGLGTQFENIGIAYNLSTSFNQKYTVLMGNTQQLGLYFRL